MLAGNKCLVNLKFNFLFRHKYLLFLFWFRCAHTGLHCVYEYLSPKILRYLLHFFRLLHPKRAASVAVAIKDGNEDRISEMLPGLFISLSSYRLRQQLHAQINAEPSGV